MLIHKTGASYHYSLFDFFILQNITYITNNYIPEKIQKKYKKLLENCVYI